MPKPKYNLVKCGTGEFEDDKLQRIRNQEIREVKKFLPRSKWIHFANAMEAEYELTRRES